MISKLIEFRTRPQTGDNAVIEDYVVLGKNNTIGVGAAIHTGAMIGDDVRIDDYASVCKLPMRAKNSAPAKGKGKKEPTINCHIGSGTVIGTGAVIYQGAVIGRDCLIADYATVREDVTIGDGTIVGKGVTIENHCTVGKNCKLETNAYITAYSVIEDDCFIGPCAVTSNDNSAGRGKERFEHFKGVTVKRGGRIGAGAVILPGRTIGEQGFAAAGSVVTRDVPPKTIVAGNPARVLREVPEDQLLENQK